MILERKNWNILGEEVEVVKVGNCWFVNKPKDAFNLCLFAGMSNESQANGLAKREFLFNINFSLLEEVNEKIKWNVLMKMEEINSEIDEHVRYTNLRTMAEFDGGHDLNMVESEMFKIMTKKADISIELDMISEEELVRFYHSLI